MSGRINVYARIRPVENLDRTTLIPMGDVVILDHPAKKKQSKYALDRIFGPECSQKVVFEETALPLIDKALDGFNCTLFAYGATGCGKTHTITGTRDDPGIIFRTMEALFNRIESLDCQVDIELGFFEVYNETIRDLLSRSKNLEIREDGSKVVVSGLSIHKPSDVHDVMDLLTSGNENRTKAFTFANSASSRSHAILQIHLSVCRSLIGEKKQTLSSVFSIIDLAGSERAVNTKNMGDRLIEGANINRSLLALGNCFNALASGKSQHVPYRDSKLTRLLKNSLSGQCNVVMITNLSPAMYHFAETQNSLKFAQRAKLIKTKSVQNIVDAEEHVSQYPKIIAALRAELKLLRSVESDELYQKNLQKATSIHLKLLESEKKLYHYRTQKEETKCRLELLEKLIDLVPGDVDLGDVFCDLLDSLQSSNTILNHNVDSAEREIVQLQERFEKLQGRILEKSFKWSFAMSMLSLERQEQLVAIQKDALINQNSKNRDEKLQIFKILAQQENALEPETLKGIFQGFFAVHSEERIYDSNLEETDCSEMGNASFLDDDFEACSDLTEIEVEKPASFIELKQYVLDDEQATPKANRIKRAAPLKSAAKEKKSKAWRQSLIPQFSKSKNM